MRPARSLSRTSHTFDVTALAAYGFESRRRHMEWRAEREVWSIEYYPGPYGVPVRIEQVGTDGEGWVETIRPGA